MRLNPRLLIPLGIFLVIVAFLAIGLTRDPTRVPSPLIGKPVPQFELARLRNPEQAFTTADLKGQVSLLNVWASWCISCRVEHPFLMELAKRGDVPIYGLNYKDKRGDALGWLARHGDPYKASAHDLEGKVGIDLGVYGAPETYVIAPDGTIAYKQIGPMDREVWREEIQPLIEKLRQSQT